MALNKIKRNKIMNKRALVWAYKFNKLKKDVSVEKLIVLKNIANVFKVETSVEYFVNAKTAIIMI
jgi:hypothetical protein